MRKKIVSTLIGLLLTLSAQAGSKWWWESYAGAGSVNLNKPGAYSATQNPRGTAAGITTNAATQPLSVVIQATSGSSNTMTCFSPQLVTPSYTFYTGSCPAITGYQLYAVPLSNYITVNSGYNANTGPVSGGAAGVPVQCCYVPTTTAAGAASYSPWSTLNSNGYSGSQRQEWTAPGTYSFTVPAGIYKVWVTVTGGGGAGASSASVSSSYASVGAYPGGSGGTVYRYPLSVLPGGSLTVYVASGGNGGIGGSGRYTGGTGQGGSTPFCSPGGGGGTSSVTYQTTAISGSGGAGGTCNLAGSVYFGGYGGSITIGGGFGQYYTQGVDSTYCSSNPQNTSGGTAYGRVSSPDPWSTTCGGGGGSVSYSGGGGGYGVLINNAYAGSYGASGANGAGFSTYGYSNFFTPGSGGAPYSASNISIGGNYYYGGGGGGGGFIGLDWSTSPPRAGAGQVCNNDAGTTTGGATGGFGYGAGGASAIGKTNTASMCAGGAGANGYAAVEW